MRKALRSGLRILAGILLLIAGFIMALPLVPGPGIAVMVLGLVILSDHFPWARRMVVWGKAKLEHVKQKADEKRAKRSPADAGNPAKPGPSPKIL